MKGIRWQKLAALILILIAKVLGADIPNEVTVTAVGGFFVGNGLEHIGKGLKRSA